PAYQLYVARFQIFLWCKRRNFPLAFAAMSPAKDQSVNSRLAAQVEKIVATTPVSDIHTHLYDPAFGALLLWGIDDLLVYDYLVAEAFRYFDLPYEKFWSLSKQQQADLIWDALFIQNS